MAFRRCLLKTYTHANIQLNKVCALWNYTEWWASIRSNGFRKKFFKTLYTFKHTIEQSMSSVKVHWVVGFKQVQWLSEEVFQNIIHIQTYNWTNYAHFQIKLSGGLQAEAIAFRRNFLKHYTHSNIRLNKLCFLWKYTEWWAWSRSNDSQKKFFKTLCTFKHTFEKSVQSVKVTWVVGFKQKQWRSEEVFWNIIHMQTYNWTKYALCEITLSGGLQAEAMASEEVFQNNIHIQTYSWTKFALTESTVSDGLQSEAMVFGRSFSKHYTHSNIQLNKVWALWKYIEWWASSRIKGFQKKVFKTLFTFKHTIEKSVPSVKVTK